MNINYKIILNGPAITGQSGTIGKDIDIVTKVDNDGLPYFPASHIKGILRDRCEYMKELSEGFSVEGYFGSEGENTTRLLFSNLDLWGIQNGERKSIQKIDRKNLFNNRDYIIGSRHGIKVDSKTRTTMDGSLFDYEFISPNMIFEGDISIDDRGQDIKTTDIKYLLASLFHLDKIGGQKSRGLGRVEVLVEGEKIDKIDKLVKNLITSRKSNDKLVLSGVKEKYNYEFTLDENTILKSRELANTVETLDYIQGGTIRGAIIEEIAKVVVDQKDLDRIVYSLKVSQGKIMNTRLTPASFFRTKYKTGEEYTFVNRILGDENEVDGIKLERFSSRFIGEAALSKKSDIGVGIDRTTRSSMDGQLFNREILEAKKTTFVGTMTLDTGICQYLKNNDTLRIGKMKNKGFGRGKIQVVTPPNHTKTSLEDRVSKLNKERKKKENEIFTLDCLSDIVLPVNEMTNIGKELADILGLDVKFIEGKSFINTARLGGYNLLNNIRKSDELIISKGSVLTYEYDPSLINTLNTIEKNGIGLRKNEGFGEVIICNPTHLEKGGF